MESCIKDYLEIFDEYSRIIKKVDAKKEAISDLNSEIEILHEKQEHVNYNRPEIIAEKMNDHVKTLIEEKEKGLDNEIEYEYKKLTCNEGNTKKSLNAIKKWIPEWQCKKIISNEPLNDDIFENTDEPNTGIVLKILSIINFIFAFIFRFDFLMFLKKPVRKLIAFIFWAVLLIWRIPVTVYNIYAHKYEKIANELTEAAFEKARDELAVQTFTAIIASTAGTIIFLILLNSVVYLCGKFSAKKTLKKNAAYYLSLYDSERFKTEMRKARLKYFYTNKVDIWKNQIELILNGNPDEITHLIHCETDESESIYELSKADLKDKYNRYQIQINKLEKNIVQMQNKIVDEVNQAKELVPEIEKMVPGLNSVITDENHNNGIMTPYVSTGYRKTLFHDIKPLMTYSHNYKPMIIAVSDETAKDGERFRKNSARLVELFMKGFFQENSFEIINMWLVDFESGGALFPERRTQGLLKIIRTQQELQKLYNDLKDTRDTVNKIYDGRIETINPEHIQKKENIIKYNIVFFLGTDFTGIDKEINQLFIGGEIFGFLPIIFMNRSDIEKLTDESINTYAFSGVLRKSINNNQVYDFDDIVSGFEYDLIISNQKNNVYAKNIISHRDFRDLLIKASGNERFTNLYVDTYELEEFVYETLKKEADDCIFFTINGVIPEYVEKNDVIQLY